MRRPKFHFDFAGKLPRFFFVLFLVSMGAGSVYLGFLQLSGNFHVVVPNELYRSAQPTAGSIAHMEARYHIRTIFNLRGKFAGKDWYEAEKAAAEKLGITLVDFRMAADQELTKSRAERLISLMRTAQKPILIHCNAGADRTALAAALYLAGVKGVEVEAAESQFSFKYGHLEVPFSPAYAMDRTYEELEGALHRGPGLSPGHG
jgi:protein tyrosine/serine phosphatase